MNYQWLAEYIGDSTTDDEAANFGEYLARHRYPITSHWSKESQEIVHNIPDREWYALLSKCFSPANEETGS